MNDMRILTRYMNNNILAQFQYEALGKKGAAKNLRPTHQKREAHD